MSTPADQLPTDLGNPGVVDLEDDWINQIGLNSESGLEPPLGTDAPAGDRGAGAVKSGSGGESADDKAKSANDAKSKNGDSAGAAKKDGVTDGEDDDDEDRAIKAAPEEHRSILERSKKAANFERHFQDGTKPAKGVVDYMKGISPARYTEIASEIVRDRLSDIKSFVENDLDDAAYAKVAAEIVKRDPAWVARTLTGRSNVKLSDLTDALDARDSGDKDSVVALPEIDAATMAELETDYEDVADFLKALKLARGNKLPKAFTSQLDAANAEIARLKAEAEGKGGNKDARTPKDGEGADDDAGDKSNATIHPDAPKTLRAVRESWGDYIETQARDKDGLDLDVTDAEREAAPEVADLKQTKLEVWMFGNTRIKSYEDGLAEHFKGNEKFAEAVAQVKYYVQRAENDNAIREGKKLQRYIDAYRKVRAETPYFVNLDKLIAKESLLAGKAPRVEKHIPGGGSRTSSPGSKVETDDDVVNGFGMS